MLYLKRTLHPELLLETSREGGSEGGSVGGKIQFCSNRKEAASWSLRQGGKEVRKKGSRRTIVPVHLLAHGGRAEKKIEREVWNGQVIDPTTRRGGN